VRFFCILFLSVLVVCCTAQELVTINVVYQPGNTYHYVEVEEKTESCKGTGVLDFGDEEVPNPATSTTKSTINKVIHTGVINRDSSFPITIHHRRTREVQGRGFYKEGVYQDSVIVRGNCWNDSLKFDSVQLLPRNDYLIRDAAIAKVRETLFDYNYAAGFFEINNRKLRPGETFINVISRPRGKEESYMDTMVFTLLQVDQNIAVLSFTRHGTFDYKTSHIDKHSEFHITGEIKVDLEKQLIIQRNQEDRFFELEKMLGLQSEIQTSIITVMTETLVE